MGLIKRLPRTLFGDYSLYRIYRSDRPSESRPLPSGATLGALESTDEIDRSGDAQLQRRAFYSGPGAYAFGAWMNGFLAAVCWYWVGERYHQRDFWPLEEEEAKLVEIFTAEPFRGRGLATALIAYSAVQMQRHGYRTLYARIWHTNRPSIRAFEKSGWRYHAFVVELHPFGRKKPLRIIQRKPA